MGAERRRFPRIKKPLEGSWRGASGGAPCRIGDISLGGCFVNTLAMPRPGDRTAVTVKFGNDGMLTVEGTVIYVEPAMGFAVDFGRVPEPTLESLKGLLQAISAN